MAQIHDVKNAIAAGKTPEGAVRINFGDPEPIQVIGSTGSASGPLKRTPKSEPQQRVAGSEPVSLKRKTKADLQQIAIDEAVELSGTETNAEIVAAIEAKRAGA